jgi:ribosomal protein L10
VVTQVGEVRALRKALPASSQLVISKNTLMKRAMTGTSFEGMADNLTVGEVPIRVLSPGV